MHDHAGTSFAEGLRLLTKVVFFHMKSFVISFDQVTARTGAFSFPSSFGELKPLRISPTLLRVFFGPMPIFGRDLDQHDTTTESLIYVRQCLTGI